LIEASPEAYLEKEQAGLVQARSWRCQNRARCWCWEYGGLAYDEIAAAPRSRLAR
jgi:hypothetical protein